MLLKNIAALDTIMTSRCPRYTLVPRALGQLATYETS